MATTAYPSQKEKSPNTGSQRGPLPSPSGAHNTDPFSGKSGDKQGAAHADADPHGGKPGNKIGDASVDSDPHGGAPGNKR